MTTLLTVAQVAARLGVSEQRVRFLIRAGRLQATRLGARSWAIEETELERLDRRPQGWEKGKSRKPADRT